MDFYGLTSINQIRGVLTVTDDDIDDSTIQDFGLDDDLAQFLDGVKDWEAMAADKTEPPAKNLRRLRRAAKYFCAGQLAKRAQVFMLKKSTDGSNEMQRSDKDGWLWMAAQLLDDAKAALEEILLDQGKEVDPLLPYNVISISTPDRDPVRTPRSTTT